MSTAIIPFQEMESMASYIVKSRLFGAKDEAQAMSLMLLAQAEGMHPMSAIQDFDIVQGRPARKTHSILARFQSAGGTVQWEEISGARACGTFAHKQGGSLRVEWTFEQAKRVGLTGKDNWKNYPQAMLRARCIAEGVRAVYPGAIGGMLSVEEAQDVGPSVDMGPAHEVKKTPTQTAEAARPTAERTERHGVLIGELEFIAKEGGQEALAKAWAGGALPNGDTLAAVDRKAIGIDELNRLKGIAGAEDVTATEVTGNE